VSDKNKNDVDDAKQTDEPQEPTEAPVPEPDKFQRLIDRAVSVRKQLDDDTSE
jgi:hypothetical protein